MKEYHHQQNQQLTVMVSESCYFALRGTFTERGTRTLRVHSTVGEQSPCKLLCMMFQYFFFISWHLNKKQARMLIGSVVLLIINFIFCNYSQCHLP